jgi:hypothetical protein
MCEVIQNGDQTTRKTEWCHEVTETRGERIRSGKIREHLRLSTINEKMKKPMVYFVII